MEKLTGILRGISDAVGLFVGKSIETVLGVYIIAGIAIVLIVLILFGVMSAIKPGKKHVGRSDEKKKDDHPASTPAPAPKHHDHPESGGHGHGAPHHNDPWWKGVLIFLGILVLGLIVVRFAIFLFVSIGFGITAGATSAERYEVAPQGTIPGKDAPTTTSLPLPSDVIDCPADPTTPIVIMPGKSIRVRIPLDKLINFKPNTEDGTIKVCDFHKPETCSSTLSFMDIGTSVLTVKNVTEGKENEQPVNFTCYYLPR